VSIKKMSHFKKATGARLIFLWKYIDIGHDQGTIN